MESLCSGGGGEGLGSVAQILAGCFRKLSLGGDLVCKLSH